MVRNTADYDVLSVFEESGVQDLIKDKDVEIFIHAVEDIIE